MSDTPPDPTERSLQTGLLRRPLTREALERVRESAENEWRTVTQPTRSRRRFWGGLAAALASIAAVAGFWLHENAQAAVLGSVIRLGHGGLEAHSLPFLHSSIHLGDTVRVGEVVTVHGPTLIALVAGGTLRVASGTVFEALGADSLKLQSGRLYVDVTTPVPGLRSLKVSTPMGTVEHVGTQFEVMVGPQGARVRVREGEVRVHNAGLSQTAAAGTELLLPRAGAVVRRSVAIFGPEWEWVEALAPDCDVENRPLAEFLTWVARETGRRLEFGDDRAREVAERTRLHGSVAGLTPLAALQAALGTTTLRLDLQGETIRVSSGG